ncbi:hydrolase Nlp/P60 [Flavobacterium sp. Sd200]|uniref:C40 family peptidase n=1 Tax=Flavobacterium sp. Sd200 TaxID=2692211 RepID=UPI001368308D|nr:C40 family peptidase [Flavobacterium sp. Sd200]MXN89652.1 hydrolase Nlp/P60 [Flavobacterium sp. Sd200]
MFGICNLAIVPLRLEPSDRSEMTSQVLFGEHFKILEQTEKWSRIEMGFDNYTGWIDNKQFRSITDAEYNQLQESAPVLNADLIECIATPNNSLMSIPIGSSITFLDTPSLNPEGYVFEGLKASGVTSKQNIVQTAFMYLNAPYLWGGRTPFGIDCSGMVQLVYKLNGYNLLRDAYQQATQGEALSFIEESEPGDLAFFDNDEGRIIHVGIIMEDNHIIHAHGKVRIDRLDHLGIYNVDSGRHTHKLRVIKKIV